MSTFWMPPPSWCCSRANPGMSESPLCCSEEQSARSISQRLQPNCRTEALSLGQFVTMLKPSVSASSISINRRHGEPPTYVRRRVGRVSHWATGPASQPRRHSRPWRSRPIVPGGGLGCRSRLRWSAEIGGSDPRRDRFVMLTQTLQVTVDRFPNVGEGFWAGRTLRYAAGQGGTSGDEDPVLIRLDMDAILHTCTSILSVRLSQTRLRFGLRCRGGPPAPAQR